MRKKRKALNFSKIVGFISLVAILCLFFVGIYRIWSGSRWDGARRFTLVLNTNPLVIFSIEPRAHKAILLTFPGNTVLEVPFGYDSYQAVSVFRLGQLDAKHRGGKLLSETIENSFGILIDGYIALKTNISDFPIKTNTDIKEKKLQYFSWQGLPESILTFIHFHRNIDTDLSFFDLIRLWNLIRKTRADQVKLVNLSETSYLSDSKLSDGTPVEIVDQDIIDFIIGDNFWDQQVRSENISIEIVNATDQNRLASKFGRLLNNLGANVILKTTSVNSLKDACTIFINKRQKSIIVDRLIHHYRCTVKMNNDTDSKQSDIQIILGEDFVR